ncbi:MULTISPECIES: PTS fructose transporter subunit IIC [Hydrocarboniphaga]|jgi:PTS system fructose-specific IIC component|uniref:protein-N(pi)-phosphohistidine--D-fructose phosphotransferase n=1 Tax=Hydrocarboniphaga effusa AP103 TaxID=1172194 RepID=I7Z9E5_9GAMM|nr:MULTISPECIES: fructose-specific PTS transporter subunit EIIC [Hydrocarboniphaga]EIT68302.1 PTS system, fructose-specific IIC component [Hydrocarboniphaga effusa AP103]MDZ4078713.1 fructose-specific PTS transporter subunit EIIC [Hydrocarboniphaga sp.]
MSSSTTRLIAVISAGERSTEAVLAAEALRRAAADAALDLAVEVRTALGTLGDTGSASEAQHLLLIGDGDFEAERFAGLPRSEASLEQALADARAVLRAATQSPAVSGATSDRPKRIVAITSCPTGIAHTFMAAEGIQQSAKALGHQVRVETQGSVGARDTLTADEIREADLVLIAADTQVDLSRFAGKPLFKSNTKPAINDGKALIVKALAEAQPYRAEATAANTGSSAPKQATSRSGPYKHLMTGVSFMLPFVTAGGLLIALAFAIGGIYVFDDAHKGTLGWSLFQIGAKAGFVLMVPALAAYIAFSIADRPGLAPGMIGGLVAANLGAGFLGGIAAGFIAGYGVYWLNRAIQLPRNLEGLKPVLILPVLGTLLTGLLMIYVVGVPVAEALAAMTAWLRDMQGSSAILLGLLLGGMMAFDMGGPINKAAYAFSTGLLASEVYSPMAATMMAGMTAPLGVALATKVFADRFTIEEREAGNAAAVLGLAFITEGAIPYAARDPLRVIPALVLGSSVSGAISMLVGAELKVPHGGVFVLPIPNAVTHLGGYLVALVVGTVLTAVALRLLKKPAPIVAGTTT